MGRRQLVKEQVGAPEPGQKAQTEVRAFCQFLCLGTGKKLGSIKKRTVQRKCLITQVGGEGGWKHQYCWTEVAKDTRQGLQRFMNSLARWWLERANISQGKTQLESWRHNAAPKLRGLCRGAAPAPSCQQGPSSAQHCVPKCQ